MVRLGNTWPQQLVNIPNYSPKQTSNDRSNLDPGFFACNLTTKWWNQVQIVRFL
jgi:hypothetical protein